MIKSLDEKATERMYLRFTKLMNYTLTAVAAAALVLTVLLIRHQV